MVFLTKNKLFKKSFCHDLLFSIDNLNTTLNKFSFFKRTKKSIKWFFGKLFPALRGRHWLSLWIFDYRSKDFKKYIPIIKKIKDCHKNKRCFIIGTGPSLNKTDLSLIKNEIIFGVNTLYRGLSHFNISCDYYAVSDICVWRKHYEEILRLKSKLFISGKVAENYLDEEKFFLNFQKNQFL